MNVSTSLPPLMAASCRGDIGAVRRLLAEGADVNVVDPLGGATALHKACQGGQLDVVRLLVEAGAFINATVRSTGHTPLAEAIWFKHVDCVRYLLDADCVVGIRSNYGFELVEHLTYQLGVNASVATEYEKLATIKALVEARADRDRNAYVESPLLQAVVDDDAARAKALLSAGADVDVRFPAVGGFNDGHTPLHVATRDNGVELCRVLLAAGADVNAVEPVFGAVPLHKATYNGNAEILALLLAQDDVDVDFQGYTNGYTALHDALWHGFEECAAMLLDHGVRLDIEGHDGKLAVDVATDVFGADAAITRRIRTAGAVAA
ncbi:Ankyrin [Xylanimonas cellulosilytica DSM 15894]|uniref:Ankyrin n=1 Tax=Xylanimonas cellulosilytica (strain DSM 15894 / JCM 12276 / CECT 5975 / KCTC 9989 / LMG 20990 / NBRC 107835 / XIL07) TaxID=446471 RepID=D1BYK4_XYLCX|nr:ankyrin repeat domain-containing protein [Xylanimonas cellulosilytica]ACZ31876.1 Ankyrin [Xylanimonas cellulosilytica DSM 15894]